jgi:hypothetical protein
MILLLSKFKQYAIIFFVALISSSRVYKIYESYSGPARLYESFKGNVCGGDYWTSYPSSYFLDGQFRYYQSLYNESLPGTLGIIDKMNGKQAEKYKFTQIEDCDYVIHIVFDKTDIKQEIKDWTVVRKEKYFHMKTPQPYRSFYIPSDKNLYSEYILFKNPKSP